MSDQTYNVRYNIEVESTEATKQLGNFTRAVEALSNIQGDMDGAVDKVNKAMLAIQRAFKTEKDGKKRSYNYTFNINTKSSEVKLGRVLTTLDKIATKAKGINLVVNPGKAFNSKGVEANAKKIIEQSQGVFRNIAGTTHTTQTSLTRSIGKINSALTHLERGRELNIKTDQAKARLNEILGLLGQVRTATGRPQRFYSMSNQILAERKQYYEVLEKTQHGDSDITAWFEWFLTCLERALIGSGEVLKSVLTKAKFWEQHSQTALNDRQRLMLNKLLDGFDGKLTSSKWAKITKSSPDTALRDINNLIARGILRKDDSGGRSTNYELT